MTRQLRPSEQCLNCGTAVATRFCAECGQENTNYRVSLGRLLGDLFEELFQLESRLWRTLWALVRHPGLLTREYNAGRRVRYTTPLRLYLLTSVAYFFVVAVVPPRATDTAQLKVELSKQEREIDFDKLPPPKSWIAKRFRERVGTLQKLDPKEASRRARELLVTNTPKVMAVLVPLSALLLMMFFWGHFYVEHLVLALHIHALTFFVGTLSQFTRSSFVENGVMLLAMGWSYVALKRVYGQSWLRTAWKTLLLTMIYAIFVSIGVGVALIGGFFLA